MPGKYFKKYPDIASDSGTGSFAELQSTGAHSSVVKRARVGQSLQRSCEPRGTAWILSGSGVRKPSGTRYAQCVFANSERMSLGCNECGRNTFFVVLAPLDFVVGMGSGAEVLVGEEVGSARSEGGDSISRETRENSAKRRSQAVHSTDASREQRQGIKEDQEGVDESGKGGGCEPGVAQVPQNYTFIISVSKKRGKKRTTDLCGCRASLHSMPNSRAHLRNQLAQKLCRTAAPTQSHRGSRRGCLQYVDGLGEHECRDSVSIHGMCKGEREERRQGRKRIKDCNVGI
ncbi:hypothetical protein DFH07DRAFT_773427 [Mycena maculata]|uniref:Uncharacterized protein n=1 Tax=Mycena maculata TaxID=230809 RepID=A0AAD7ND60_9AGAR|nr:hypothetical protein DFH07DRAFT_773427 [Mycena maculata]